MYGFNDLLPKNRVWKGKNGNFTVEKPGKHCGMHVMKVTITSDVTEHQILPENV